MTTHVFTVAGMHCPGCGMLIDEAVEGLPGVRSSSTSVRKGRTVVEADDTVAAHELAAAITAAGYAAQPMAQ